MPQPPPDNWRDLPMTIGPGAQHILGPDGQPMSALAHLLLASVKIGEAMGLHPTGRALIAAAEAAETEIERILDLKAGEPINTFLAGGDGL